MNRSANEFLADDVRAGQAVYSPRVLRTYDLFVLGLSNRLIWKCPTKKLLAFYNEHVSGNHLDVGVGTGYFLHCLPGDLNAKAAVFDHLGTLLKPGGVIFGSTLLGEGVHHGFLASRLMALYNRKQIFSNTRDSLDELKELLAARFAESDVRTEGCAALFWARGPK